MKIDHARPGLRVKSQDLNEETAQALIATHKENRHEAVGTLLKPLKQGGMPDGPFWWWVEHDDDRVAPYNIHELELLEDQTPRLKPLGSPIAKTPWS